MNNNSGNRALGMSHSFGSNYSSWFSDDNVLTLNAWHLVAVTYDSTNSSTEPLFYVDGAPVGSSHYGPTSDPTNSPEDDASRDLLIGNAAGGTSRTFDGSVDEVRVSGIIRSPQWLATSHANQVNPGAFVSAGPEQDTR